MREHSTALLRTEPKSSQRDTPALCFRHQHQSFEDMKIASHIEKFRRLDAMKQRLDRQADSELWIWTAMNAGTHLLNAALHHCGATEEIDSFHTQVEGVYAVPNRADATLSAANHAPGDVMHVGQPPCARSIPAAVQRAGAALRIIEDLREPHVRGSEPLKDDDLERWERAYCECVADLSCALGLPGRGRA